MNILIINYHYPPSNRAHAHRWSLIKKKLEDYGFHVEVICGGTPSENDIQSNVKRINFPFINNGTGITSSKLNTSKINNFNIVLKKHIKFAYRKLFWPDGLWYWFFPVAKEVYKRKNIKYDIVVSYTPTFTSVLAGLVYKFFHKECKLIIDFGDPFSLSQEMPVNNYFLYGFLNKRVEKYAFNKAHAVCLNNKMLLSRYQTAYPMYNRFIEVPQIVEIDQFYEEKSNDSDNIIKIGYVGSLHFGIREPFDAIKIINKIFENTDKPIKVDFYGGINSIENINWGGINYNGPVERVMAIKLMKELDIIINIENEDCPMVPSKIYECIATGRPILNFLSSTKISSFEGYPLLLNVDENTEIEDIVEYIINIKNKYLTKNEVIELLTENQVDRITEKYIEIGTK